MKFLNVNVAPACGLVLALLLLGCANTTMTARVNPETAGRQIARVMVKVDHTSLEQRQTAEEALCSELAKASVWTCLTYSKVFFIGETYTPEQMQRRMQNSDIDTVLLLKPTDSGTTSTSLGSTPVPSSGLALLDLVFSDASAKPFHDATSLDKIWAKYEVKLISVSDDRVIWFASANANGTVFANWKDLITSTARQTVRQLAQSGLLPAK